MNKSKQNMQFMFILMAALLLFAGVFIATTGTNFKQKAGYSEGPYIKVQGDGDLDRAVTTLNDADLETLDSELEKNDSDASSF